MDRSTIKQEPYSSFLTYVTCYGSFTLNYSWDPRLLMRSLVHQKGLGIIQLLLAKINVVLSRFVRSVQTQVRNGERTRSFSNISVVWIGKKVGQFNKSESARNWIDNNHLNSTDVNFFIQFHWIAANIVFVKEQRT